MEFCEFVQLLYPVIGGKSTTDRFTHDMFDAIVTENGLSILEDYSKSSFKAYYNGNTKITNIAKAISPYMDQIEFSNYIDAFSDEALLSLCQSFTPYISDITKMNASEKLAILFADIIKTAASRKRKSARQDAPENMISTTQVNDSLSEVLKEGAQSNDLVTSFKNECTPFMLTIIDEDPSAEPIKPIFPDRLAEVVQKWSLLHRQIEDPKFRTLAGNILRAFDKYTYYISDTFLKYIPEIDRLLFRNETPEDGDRNRDILQPESYKLRCEIGELYKALYSIPEEEVTDTESK